MQLSIIDIFVVIIYILGILYVGLVISRKKEQSDNSDEDYLLAGRSLTIPLFVATLVATWYGSILGVGEFVYSGGLVAWISFGLPYYIAAALFAWFAAGKIRSMNVRTIPEQITANYGERAGWLSSLIILVITIPAAYVLMLGIIVQMFTGWPLWQSIVVGALISLVYIYTGGFKADVYTNAAQFIIMYLGFGALLIFSMLNLGSLGEMALRLPDAHLSPTGGYSIQYIFVWYIIAFQTFVDPSFHQRCAAAKTPRTAQKGILISILFWAVFDTFTLTTGLYARAYFDVTNPLMAFPVLADNVLPVFWKGIFVVSLLATVMSTLDSYAFISAATIGNDILAKFKKISSIKFFTTKNLTKIGLIITSVIAVIMSVILPSAVELIYKTASIAVPGLLMPLMISFTTKYNINKNRIIWIMVAGSGTSLLWTIMNYFHSQMNFINLQWVISIEPMLPGIFISLLLTLIFVEKKSSHLENI